MIADIHFVGFAQLVQNSYHRLFRPRPHRPRPIQMYIEVVKCIRPFPFSFTHCKPGTSLVPGLFVMNSLGTMLAWDKLTPKYVPLALTPATS